MRHIRRVVLDTSVLVSAALRPGSVPDQAVSRALSSCDICSSLDTLAELEQVLSRAKFDRYMDRKLRLEFFALIDRTVRLFSVQSTWTGAWEISALSVCRDPADFKFLALALVAEADAIVSGDDDLLVLNPWQGILILTAAEFLHH